MELQIRKHLQDAYKKIELNPLDYTYSLQAGEFHAILGEQEKAYSCFTTATSSKKTNIKWAALIKKATIMSFMGCFSIENIIDPLMEAYNIRPDYVDPLIVASQVCRGTHKTHQALLYSTMAISIPIPDDTNDPELYAWKSVYEYALCAHQACYFDNAYQAFNEILERKDFKLPNDVLVHIKQELSILKAKRNEKCS